MIKNCPWTGHTIPSVFWQLARRVGSAICAVLLSQFPSKKKVCFSLMNFLCRLSPPFPPPVCQVQCVSSNTAWSPGRFQICCGPLFLGVLLQCSIISAGCYALSICQRRQFVAGGGPTEPHADKCLLNVFFSFLWLLLGGIPTAGFAAVDLLFDTKLWIVGCDDWNQTIVYNDIIFSISIAFPLSVQSISHMYYYIRYKMF